ncbi:MAG: DUF1573 domain-containing protein [Bacteroidota bacterium]
MNKERTEQLKIALLGIIAVVLIIQTVVKISSNKATDTITRDRVIQPDNKIPITPGQQQPTSVPINPVQQNPPGTTMTFEQLEVNLGTLSASAKPSHTFKFTNTGSQPLKFTNVKGDPGTLATSWPRDPIPQGGTGEIKVELTGDNPPGALKKTIHLNANTQPACFHLTVIADIK